MICSRLESCIVFRGCSWCSGLYFQIVQSSPNSSQEQRRTQPRYCLSFMTFPDEGFLSGWSNLLCMQLGNEPLQYVQKYQFWVQGLRFLRVVMCCCMVSFVFCRVLGQFVGLLVLTNDFLTYFEGIVITGVPSVFGCFLNPYTRRWQPYLCNLTLA
jgi:hypothetical protein